MKEKKIKTNALRILDKQKIEYEIHTYEWSEGTSSGLGVAEKLPELADRIFKTIVLKGKTKNLHVCVVPGAAHLDLKKVAKACGIREEYRIYTWWLFTSWYEEKV